MEINQNKCDGNCFCNCQRRYAETDPVSAEPVAYLDLGAGGYMDVGTDLTDEQLAALPKGRHMLAIVGTYGVEGFTPAPVAAQAQQPVSNTDELPDFPPNIAPTDEWNDVLEEVRAYGLECYKAASHESVNSRLFLYEKALKEICNIQNLDIGGEWDEIEEARQIAKNALKEEI